MLHETPAGQRSRRYLDAEQGEVSDPDEWASIHDGMAWDDHSRMEAFSSTNWIRLDRAVVSLQSGCELSERS